MFSVEEINEMQKTIDQKDRIIKVLKERVRQWVKEYNILDEIIEMYKMSENEAKEKAELKAYKDVNEDFKTAWEELKAENERLKFKLDTVEADYKASEIEIEDLKNKLNLLITANNHLLKLDKYRQKELETKAEATKSNIHNLALLSKANKTSQEIKKYIAKICKEECGYVQKKRCPDCDCRFGAILDLITKAEEE